MGFSYMGGTGMIWWLGMAILLVVPFWKILPRYGMAAPISLVAVFPLAALVLLWIIAFKDGADGPADGV